MPELTPQRALEIMLGLFQSGRLQEAEVLGHKILAANPRDIGAINLLGLIAHQVGRNHLALEWYRRGIAIDDRHALLFNNMGEAYRALGRGDEAIHAYEAAIARNPKDPTPRNNIAIVLALTGRLEQAITVWRDLVSAIPDFAAAHNNLGNALLDRGHAAEAAESHHRAADLAPEESSFFSNYLRDIQHLPDITPEKLREAHREWWRRHGQRDAPVKNLTPPSPSPGTPGEGRGEGRLSPRNHLPQDINAIPSRPLRIGWVSGDFREHSVAYFLLPLFDNHDRANFAFTCYSGLATEDHITRKFHAAAQTWRSIRGLTDEQAAKMIRDDRIDILIDLSGHTADNRMRLFARKPAPIQVSYLGYPCTTGVETIGYRITDSLADPPGMTESHFSERLLRLPRTAWCYRPSEDAPPVSALPADRLGRITFGSFNSYSKVTTHVIETWAKILRELPDSRLLLKANGLADPIVQQRIESHFAAHGISPDRLALEGKQTEMRDHLARYNDIDIALDTFPYNGTTTTCEALWMGVPVVTVEGQMHMARVGASLLTNINLETLIAPDPDRYVTTATATARDLPRLRDLRSTMRQRLERSPLRDEKQFARNMEQALKSLWLNHISPSLGTPVEGRGEGF